MELEALWVEFIIFLATEEQRWSLMLDIVKEKIGKSIT